MNKTEFKIMLFSANLKQWEVCEKIGIREDVFSRMLRHDLKPEIEEKVKRAIESLTKERSQG